MKKRYTVSILLAAGFSTFLAAQQFQILPAPALPERLPDPVSVPQSQGGFSNFETRGDEVFVGATGFDLQTYDVMPQRLVAHSGGKLSAIWMSGFNSAGWPDRGTSHNTFDGTAWGIDARVEDAAIRTGFPAFAVLGDGTEVVVAHRTTNAPPYVFQVSKKAPGSDTWETSDVPNALQGGSVWPYVAAGGTDGMSLHLVGIPFEGTRELRYSRSQDGGATWDIQDAVIPGLDSLNFPPVQASSYGIVARGNTVAVALFHEWEDVVMFKSEDNGDTWTQFTVNEFPLEHDYVADTGYDSTIVIQHEDMPDPLALFTSDGNGSLVIDHQGKVHVFFANRFVIDFDLTNATTEYYPGSGGIPADSDLAGISYWNEDMAGETPVTVAYLTDFDGDSTVNIPDNTPQYWGNAYISYPQAAVDAAGDLYLVYAAANEGFVNDGDTLFHHIYVTKSADGGANWTPPYDLVNPDLLDEDLFSQMETAYPAIAADVDGRVDVIFQRDFKPDAFLINTAHGAGENDVLHVSLTTDLTLLSDAPAVLSEAARLRVLPNPFEGVLNVELKGWNPGHATLRLFDAAGKLQAAQEVSVSGTGRFSMPQAANLPAGIYWLQASSERQVQAVKCVKF